jgi:hypothetical protein
MNQRTTVAAPATTTCFLGADCSWIGPGHAMAFAQDEIASDDRDGWRDTVVDTVTPGGWLALTAVDGSERVIAWNHSDLVGALSPGDPVAINPAQHVLAVGQRRFNVLVI